MKIRMNEFALTLQGLNELERENNERKRVMREMEQKESEERMIRAITGKQPVRQESKVDEENYKRLVEHMKKLELRNKELESEVNVLKGSSMRYGEILKEVMEEKQGSEKEEKDIADLFKANMLRKKKDSRVKAEIMNAAFVKFASRLGVRINPKKTKKYIEPDYTWKSTNNTCVYLDVELISA